MKPDFEVSAQTRKLIDFFGTMKVGQEASNISYPEASKRLGFNVNPQTLASARKIAERDHGIYIATIRQYGFFRGTHLDMKSSGPSFLLRMRKGAKRLASRMELALQGNLPERDHREASEMLTRGRIIHDTAEKPRATSNRKTREEPPVPAQKSGGYGNIASIRK